MTTAAAPKDLAPMGLDLWQRITHDYELSTAERALLREACRTTDELETLRLALTTADAVTQGSTGQPVVNRLYEELRQHRLHLARLLASLDLPTADVGAMPARGIPALRPVGRATKAG